MKKWLWLALFASSTHAEIRQVNYPGFTVWLDCEQHGAVQFQYTANKDVGQLRRSNGFMIDPNVPASCQPSSNAAFGGKYDRGHLVPANHLDHLPDGIKSSNYVTNILPQTASMNRGAWLQTEEIIECYRDIEPLNVIGGVLWGNDPTDDYFVKTHNVKTPSAYWKVVVKQSGQSIAWIVPNTLDATRSKLDGYIVSVATIEQITKTILPVQNKTDRSQPWPMPANCNKG
jgi:endonuclease G